MGQLTLHYDEFPGPADCPAADRELLARATAALGESYAPYSRFRVAAAARLADGTLVTGVNTENAAYPVCLCAERAALAAAASLRPGLRITDLAVTVRSPSRTLDQPAFPCGSCRQVLLEHEARYGAPVRLILRAETGPVWTFAAAGDLLPFGFSGEVL